MVAKETIVRVLETNKSDDIYKDSPPIINITLSSCISAQRSWLLKETIYVVDTSVTYSRNKRKVN
ncbi:hypothetical protein M8C21_021025 [Ambrosia artemisiifolia]|uniref:Uncharacterized protein n=1 Tax=Ambrosia artemisiifolia TaxID=4212 RepID=A0AAD5CL50_AMBAR|nr:hypothetical protein M8C21_021025 [Ambrosia artemisiifolia]